MELNVKIDELRKCKLFLATPMFGGQCSGMFARSLADLTSICSRNGIPLQMYFLFNESLITRARNYCVDEFLRSGATHLMFIDSDISFDANDIIAMMAMNINSPEKYKLICGPYPKKTISWEKIKMAVDKGFADKDPRALENFVGDYVFNPKSGVESFKISEPIEVREGGTGFMMISRTIFEKYDIFFPQYKYKPDHIRTENFDGTREIMCYFNAEIDPESKRYLSEDYFFCYNVQKMGESVWFCPWMKLKHQGSYVFGGSLADLAIIGANATADPNQIKKGKIER